MTSDLRLDRRSGPLPPLDSERRAKQPSRRPWWTLALSATGVLSVVASAAALMRGAGASGTASDLPTHTISRGELLVTVTEQGTLESSNNTEIKCRVRGDNTITWVVESGRQVKPGDELVRLETLLIEEEISERTKFAHLAKSEVARSTADVARAELAISEYLQGKFVTELATLEKNLAVASSKHLAAEKILAYSETMASSGYASELEVEEKEFAVSQAELQVKLIETQIEVLQQFTKKEQLTILNGEQRAAKAKLEADKETAFADQQRLLRAEEELAQCVITAQRSGMVIYPKNQAWEDVPDIEEGATVHKDQVLLLMPDLSQMQVKVGVHESIIERVKPGLAARITLPGKTLDGDVASVASVAKPAGWWTGNVVKYDTLVKLPPEQGLKPGMSVEVEVIIKRHQDVLTIPAAAVIETNKGHACWVATDAGPQRRAVQLGDSSDMFLVVEAGLKEGDQVVLDPLANIQEAQIEAAKTLNDTVGSVF